MAEERFEESGMVEVEPMRDAGFESIEEFDDFSPGVSRIFLLRAARRSPARRRPWVFLLDVPTGTTAGKTLRAPCGRAPLLALATKARETPALPVAGQNLSS